ncbi:hypothetical protein Leryth_004331 [Lithospermum erythrorhizon]|uniref:RNA metabolism protein n=1 Tax=Lithospermum erythrorhizon TaxID=34254 RepID=A0AAV3Q091_LITER|nr:hypothetical protein Leryth_004331 [Lithospermum erythrorhizon]
MAQAQPERETIDMHEIAGKSIHDGRKKNDDQSASSSSASFKFNAQAPEFVPKTTPASAVPVTGYFVPCYQYLGGGSGGGGGSGDQWIFVGDSDSMQLQVPGSSSQSPKNNNVLTEELHQKLIKQVEYQFNDLSLLANENLVKHIQKDPEGFVPITIVASTKKLKSLVNGNHTMLAQALRASTKLDVSSDSKKVKRKKPFTDKEKEELQSRTVVAENLPDDHSHQNIEKIFNVAGTVKTIRICHPQEANSRNKVDHVISTKLHALVEFENVESAEKAVEKLNDERNWRKGLKVRLLLRRTPKSVLQSKKSDFDDYLEDDEVEAADNNSPSHPQAHPVNSESGVSDNNAGDSPNSLKKVWPKGRGKPRPQRTSNYNGRGTVSQPSVTSSSEGLGKQTIKGPRMPDGTKGFNMGRGKPISIPV